MLAALCLCGLTGCSHKWQQLETYAPYGSSSSISRSDVDRLPPGTPGVFEKVDLSKKVERQRLVQKLDSLFIVIDGSAAMNDSLGSITRYEYGVELLNRFIETLPKVNGMLISRVIEGRFRSDTRFKSVYGAVPISKDNLQMMVRQVVRNQSKESVASVLKDITRDLEIVDGNVAVMLMTSWNRIDTEGRNALKALRHRHGRRVCIYTIGLGNRVSKANLHQRGQCGGSYTGQQIEQGTKMARFIETVFFAGPADNDQDGIYDYLDQCPNSSRSVPIATNGCARQSTSPRLTQPTGYSS